MKRAFKVELIWDTNDEHNLLCAVDDLVEKLNQINGIKAINPHVYPEDPIIVLFQENNKLNFNKEIDYLKKVLLERNKSERALKVFFEGLNYLESENWYEAIMKIGVPQTCAVQIFRGVGATPDEAFKDMRKNILEDKPLRQDDV